MHGLLLYNARVVLEREIAPGGVLVRDGRIAATFAGGQTPTGMSSAESIDLHSAYLVPGMIDIHIHGSAGVDVQAAGVDELGALSDFLLREGVTGYFATLVPAGDDEYREALEAVNAYEGARTGPRAAGGGRARILGIHFEGPFVSPRRSGALRTRFFRTYDGDPRSLELFTGGRQGHGPTRPTLMTLAPETEGGLDLVRDLERLCVRAFIGHSEADPETLDLAAAAGARHITHFPNALAPLHHRNPGSVAWGLTRADVSVDCIADFHHCHPLMLRLMRLCKGADAMALISDAIAPAGLGDGDYMVWGERIEVRGGKTALTEGPAAGTIAGSVITMRQALKNICGLGTPLPEAMRMAALVPARAAGIDGEYGSIEAGKRADLIALDEDFAVRLAIAGGEVGFRA